MNSDDERFLENFLKCVKPTNVEESLEKLREYFPPSNADEILEKCLKCFQPALSEKRCPGVRAAVKDEIQNIARSYKINCALQELSGPFRVAWQAWRESLPPKEDDFNDHPSRRGRPVDIPANVLVMACKNLLIRYGCKCGVSRYKNRKYESQIVKLVGFVYELSGMPAMPIGKPWQDRVERLLSSRKRAQIIGNGDYETGLEDPIAEGDDPELDAMVRTILESLGVLIYPAQS